MIIASNGLSGFVFIDRRVGSVAETFDQGVDEGRELGVIGAVRIVAVIQGDVVSKPISMMSQRAMPWSRNGSGEALLAVQPLFGVLADA